MTEGFGELAVIDEPIDEPISEEDKVVYRKLGHEQLHCHSGGKVSGNCGAGYAATRWIQQEMFSAEGALRAKASLQFGECL